MAKGAMASDTPTAPGPLAAYRQRVRTGDIKHDPLQELAAEKLEMLHNRLRHYKPRKGGLLSGLLGRRPDPAPEGLYLYGGVGRGKSMLMDLFFETTDFQPKRRVHFHAFMLEIHDILFQWRRLDEKGRRDMGFQGDDPIPPLADKIAAQSMLLCFDEFHVTDIADAMILGRFFEALLERGVVMVITSNRSPSTLYEGGINRQLFLPFIDLIEHKLDVLHLASPIDYRLQRLMGLPVYHMPLSVQTTRELDDSFDMLTDGVEAGPETLTIKGRSLVVPKAAKGVARMDFAALCSQPLGAADYDALASRYRTLIMDGIPQMGRERRNEAKRFVTLIDILYEHKTRLICGAAAEPAELYPEGDGSFEFGRTASRLIEMQSRDYFAGDSAPVA